jgi:hypothetical protein
MRSYYQKLLYDKKIYKCDTKHMLNFNTLEIYFIELNVIYGSSSCIIGQLPRLPIVADAADRQVM